MAIRGKKRRTLEQIEEDEKKKQIAEKDNKERKEKVYCRDCNQTVTKKCINHLNCFHNQMQ